MKTNHIHTALLILLTALIIYQSFFEGGNLRQAQALTSTMATQLDTLRSISTQYQDIHHTYEGVYRQLVASRYRVMDMSRQLAVISRDQQASVHQIQDAPQVILSEYDSLPIALTDDKDINDILFQP